MNHIRCPHTVVEVGEDRSVGCHGHNIRIVLDAHHIDSLTECSIERAHIAEALGYGIFAYINLAALAVVVIILVEVLGKPGWVSVVVLVEQLYALVAFPLRVIIAPGYHVADEMHLRIFRQYGILELLEALVVVVALSRRIRLVVLITNLQILDVVWFRMTVLGTQGTILGGNRTIGILQGIHALVNPRLDAVHRSYTAVPQTYVYYIERLGVQVFGKLQILIESHTVAGAVAPVHVLMSRTLLDRTDGLLPVECILRRLLSLYVATARETDELRMDVIEKLSQIRAQAIFAVLESRREEAYHVENDGTLAVGYEFKLCLGIVGIGCKFCCIFGPFLAYLGIEGCFSIHLVALGVGEASLQSALVATLCPERELVGSALYGIDAPEALVDERGCGSRFGSNGKLESLALCLVEQTLVDELCLDFCTFLGGSFPGRDVFVVILERAVADEFGIESAVSSMVDILEEDTI